MRKTSYFFFASLLTLALSSGLNAGWRQTNGLSGMRINALEADGTWLFAGTGDNGVFRSDDNGANWQEMNTGLTNLNVQALAVRGGYLFAGTLAGGVFRSGDSGTTWQAMNTGISTLNIQALGGNDSFLFAGTRGGGVCRSSDNGEQWLEVSKGLVHVNIFSIGVSSMYVFVGTWGGSAFRTEDNGLNWFLVTNGLFHPRENIIPYSFAVADTFLFAGTGGGGVFRAKDSARVWYPFNTGLPDNAFVTALVLSADTLFAATDSGVFRSIATNNSIDNLNCANWVADNDGLADTIVLSFVLAGNTLYAGTDGGGVWYRPLSEMAKPLAPVAALPETNDTTVTDSIVYVWNTVVPDVLKYQLQVGSDSLFTAPIHTDSTIADTMFVLTDLSDNQSYWWRVRAFNEAGWGPFSIISQTFVRLPTTATPPFPLTMAYYGVSFKNGLIRYGIPKSCYVSLTAYDAGGRAVWNYVSSQQASGEYTVNLNLTPLATGLYFLHLVAGGDEHAIPLTIY